MRVVIKIIVFAKLFLCNLMQSASAFPFNFDAWFFFRSSQFIAPLRDHDQDASSTKRRLSDERSRRRGSDSSRASSGKYGSDSSSGREFADDKSEGGLRSVHTHYVASEFGEDDKTVGSKSVLTYGYGQYCGISESGSSVGGPSGWLGGLGFGAPGARASAGASGGPGVTNQGRREEEWDESTLGADTIRTNFTNFVDDYDDEPTDEPQYLERRSTMPTSNVYRQEGDDRSTSYGSGGDLEGRYNDARGGAQRHPFYGNRSDEDSIGVVYKGSDDRSGASSRTSVKSARRSSTGNIPTSIIAHHHVGPRRSSLQHMPMEGQSFYYGKLKGGDSSCDFSTYQQQEQQQEQHQQYYGSIKDDEGSRGPLRKSQHGASARRRSRTSVPSDDVQEEDAASSGHRKAIRRPSSQQLDNNEAALADVIARSRGDNRQQHGTDEESEVAVAGAQTDDEDHEQTFDSDDASESYSRESDGAAIPLEEDDDYGAEYSMPLNDAHEMDMNNASAMEWQIDNPNGQTSYRQLPRPSSEEPPSPTEDRSETPSSDGHLQSNHSTGAVSAESFSSFSPKNYVVNWTRSNGQGVSEAPRLPALDQSASDDKSGERDVGDANQSELKVLSPTPIKRAMKGQGADADSIDASSRAESELSAPDRYSYLLKQESGMSDHSYLYNAEVVEPIVQEDVENDNTSAEIHDNHETEAPKEISADKRRETLLRGLLSDTVDETKVEDVTETADTSQKSLFSTRTDEGRSSSGKDEGESTTTSLKSLSTKKEMLLQNLLAPAVGGNTDSLNNGDIDERADAANSVVSDPSVESKEESPSGNMPSMSTADANKEHPDEDDDSSIGQVRDTSSPSLLDRKAEYLLPPPSPSVLSEAPSSAVAHEEQSQKRMEGSLLDRRADFLIPPPAPSVLSVDQDSQSMPAKSTDTPNSVASGDLLQRKAAYLVPPPPPSELSIDRQSEAPSMGGSERSAVVKSTSNLLDRKNRYLVPPPPPSELSVDRQSEILSVASTGARPTGMDPKSSVGLLERKAKYLIPPPPASVLSVGQTETQPTSLAGSDSPQSAPMEGGLLERKAHFLESIPPASEVSQTVKEEDFAEGNRPRVAGHAADEESIGRRDSSDEEDDTGFVSAPVSTSPAVLPSILKRKDALLVPVDIEQSEFSASTSSHDEEEAADKFDAVQSCDPAALKRFTTGGVQPRDALRKEGSWSRKEIQRRSDHELSSNSDITHSHHSASSIESPPREDMDKKKGAADAERSPLRVAASGLTEEGDASTIPAKANEKCIDKDQNDGSNLQEEWPEHNERMLARPVKPKQEVDPIEKDWVILCLAPTNSDNGAPANDDETSYASSTPTSAHDENVMTLYPSDIVEAELGARKESDASDIAQGGVRFHNSLNIDSGKKSAASSVTDAKTAPGELRRPVLRGEDFYEGSHPQDQVLSYQKQQDDDDDNESIDSIGPEHLSVEETTANFHVSELTMNESWRPPVSKDTGKMPSNDDNEDDKSDGVVDTFGWSSRHILSDGGKSENSTPPPSQSSRVKKGDSDHEADNNASERSSTVQKTLVAEFVDITAEDKSTASKADSIESEKSLFNSDSESDKEIGRAHV